MRVKRANLAIEAAAASSGAVMETEKVGIWCGEQ